MTDFDWEEIEDEGVSGELKDRPGIERLRAGIENRVWDLVICEDSSRLYRNLAACLEIVGLAVDNKIRVICIGDDVDTAEEDWYERLQEAQQHHCRDNRFTRRRVKRGVEDLWEMGAAVGHLRPGLVRTPTKPAIGDKPAEGPYYDSLDPQWIPVIYEAYVRIAGVERQEECNGQPAVRVIGEPTWSVAQWLTQQGLPKINSRPGPWLSRDVVTLIQSEIYRALELHGKLKAVKKFASGKSVLEPNDPEDIKQREVPHLRVVPDWLWYRANEAIKGRTRGGRRKATQENDTPTERDSRRPLARIFDCDICEYKMYNEGRNEGGYRCGSVHSGDCWNKTTALRDFTHHAISRAVCQALLPERTGLEALVAYAGQVMQDDGHWQAEEKRLEAEVRELHAKCVRLGSKIEGRDNPPETLVQLLEQREAQTKSAEARLEDWRRRMQTRPALPTVDTIIAAIEEASQLLLDFDSEASILLERLLVGPIRAVPYQLFGGNKVVLRAEFELNLAAILPDELLALLAGSAGWQPSQWLPVKQIKVDLFESSPVQTYAVLAHELRPYLTLVEIADLLGTSKRQAHLASQLGKAMAAAGITDPYVRLTAPPKAASRWRVHAKHRPTGSADNRSDDGNAAA